MRWRRGSKEPSAGSLAKRAAQDDLQTTLERWPEVHQLTAQLEAELKANHFSIAVGLAYGLPRGAAQ